MTVGAGLMMLSGGLIGAINYSATPILKPRLSSRAIVSDEFHPKSALMFSESTFFFLLQLEYSAMLQL